MVERQLPKLDVAGSTPVARSSQITDFRISHFQGRPGVDLVVENGVSAQNEGKLRWLVMLYAKTDPDAHTKSRKPRFDFVTSR